MRPLGQRDQWRRHDADLASSDLPALAGTREIATDAGVNEALIFRHFGNKVGLFRVVVVEPFRLLIEEFVDNWEKN